MKTTVLKKYLKEITAGILFILMYFPTLIWVWERWFARDSYYTHGILVPLVTIILIWRKRDELAQIKREESVWGIRLVVIGILIHLVSSLFRIYFSSGFSMMIVLIGLILHFWGSKIFKKILFPIGFLVFMLPLPMVLIANISFKLKLMAAQISTWVLNEMRIPAIRDGSIIKMRDAYVVVDDVCSGLRSLISLTALGSIFAHLMNASNFKKILLFVSTIPIAVITNVFRIVFLAAVTEIWGPQYATGVVHDIAGYMVFVLAFIFLHFVGRLLE